ncbi:hypothetical protein IIB79_05000, partial [candidate division KSB1 bacterium]|nr:hypothetical protein [candidate division KSB1 bacterium]
RLTGADKNSQIGDSVRLDEFEISDLSYKDHTFLFNNLNFGHELQIDGLLGYEFLSQYITAIDYKNQKLYIFKRYLMTINN